MKALAVVGLIGLGGVVLGGCTGNDYFNENTSPVIFRISDVNGGSPFPSDVFPVAADTIGVTVAVRGKSQQIPAPQIPMAVFVEQYHVRFYRSDGRNTEGVDVPYSISGRLTTVEDLKDSGGTTIAIEVVRAQAKLESPLINLRDAGVNLGGSKLLTCFAEITLYGHTTVGEAVSATGTAQIDFADYQ